nr:uncharacterized protein LOC118876877 [Drosophila suzukii]
MRGRTDRNDQWSFNGTSLELIKEFKYLGVMLASDMKFKKHATLKLQETRIAIGSTWNAFFQQKNIKPSTKYLATASDHMLFLGSNTPDYAIHFETGIPSLFAYSLGIHFKCVRKALEMPPHRYPNIIVKHLLENRSKCFQTWCSLANAHNME